jgi:hypothetical protein
MPVAYAEMVLAGAKASPDHKFDTVERCDAGHMVMISQPDWTTKMLRRAAGESVE